MSDQSISGRSGISTGGLDRFRLLAAFLVIAIHISPLSAINADADFFLTRILARIAVPFFFLVTGYFILGDGSAPGKTRRFLLRLCLFYGLSMILYLPFGIYAGHYKELTPAGIFRMVFFDGTFYHLWYFPACILAVFLVSLMKKCRVHPAAFVAAALLYLAGLFGDSYYGFTSSVPFLKTVYESFFQISSYTRNGLFFAPLFLVLGAWLSYSPVSSRSTYSFLPDLLGFLTSFALMTAEAFLLRTFSSPRHDSMYVFLVPSMFFLFRLLLLTGCSPSKKLRTVSTWIYVLHPAVIVVLRMIAKPVHLTGFLVDNPLFQFLSVSAVSTGASFAVAAILPVKAPKPSHKKENRTVSTFGRRAWIELNLNALRHNVDYLKGLLPEGCRLMPAVKANAYGHGAVSISRELNRLGIDAFCVACVSEGVHLRKHGVTGEILVLGYTHPSQFPLLCRYHLTQTVVDAGYGNSLNAFGQDLHVHVGIDSGMHRLGERSENMDDLQNIWQMEHLIIDGVFTHLCTADGKNERERDYTKDQIAAFYRTINKLEKSGCACPGLHLLSSYGYIRYPEFSENYVRPGIALYGVLSSKEDSVSWGASLEPVLSLKARIATVKKLHAGESAGYGIMYTAEEERILAILAIGYADGLPRALSCGNGSVLINGRKAPIVGRICMDQTIVDVSGIPDVNAGDYAVLIGSWGIEQITACDLAEASGTITNELLSRLGGRLERISIEK